MDEKFKEFTRKLHEILKPLGYRKEGVNYPNVSCGLSFG